MDMDSTWFFEGSRSFLKAFVVLLVPVWMNPSGWLVSGFLRIGLVWFFSDFGFLTFLVFWFSYRYGLKLISLLCVFKDFMNCFSFFIGFG